MTTSKTPTATRRVSRSRPGAEPPIPGARSAIEDSGTATPAVNGTAPSRIPQVAAVTPTRRRDDVTARDARTDDREDHAVTPAARHTGTPPRPIPRSGGVTARDAPADGQADAPPGRGAVVTAEGSGRRSKYTLLLDEEEALGFDELALVLRRRTGRRLDKSEAVRALIRLTGDDGVLALLVAALGGEPAAGGTPCGITVGPDLYPGLASWAEFAGAELGFDVAVGDVVQAMLRRLTMPYRDDRYDVGMASYLMEILFQDLQNLQDRGRRAPGGHPAADR